jgi:D-alanine-D-alanine ligase
MAGKKRVAVFLGGRSVEHDVSIVSGLQALAALDGARYDAFPVYVDFSGAFWCGDALRERKNYIPDTKANAAIERVMLDTSTPGAPVLAPTKTSLFGSKKTYPYDIALPAFHGTHGEDGAFQGLMEFHGIPYTGMRVMASSLFMDKAATKLLLGNSAVQVLPHVELRRPEQGLILPRDRLEAALGSLGFPLIVKPATLGSSVGVALVQDFEELTAVLPTIFKLDNRVIAEPAVQNLVEYNVAVSRLFGEVKVSAIERPKSSSALLDFKEKYLSGGGSKKLGGGQSGGMLSLTREINPALGEDLKGKVTSWAKTAFERAAGTGAPRIDFLCNSQTGEIFLNEVNACPGSFGYFLWEAAEEPVLFTDFLTALIEEGWSLRRPSSQFSDPTPEGARLFSKRG